MLKDELRSLAVKRELQAYLTNLFNRRIGQDRWAFAGPMPAALSEHAAPTYSSLDLAGILEVPIKHADLPGVEITVLVVLPAAWRDELDSPALVFPPTPPLHLPQGDNPARREVFSDDPETGSHPVATP